MTTHHLKGLVLAGGRSRRMGKDKGLIRYHDKPERYHLADLLKPFCDEVYISCRPGQSSKIIRDGYLSIADTAQAKEQYGAILSAQAKYPKAAWLVIACDLPLVSSGSISYLISHRDQTKLATAYISNVDDLPEPLFAIWEPASQKMLVRLLGLGISCPRKALIKSASAVKLVDPKDPLATLNINTPDAARHAKMLIASRNQV